MECSAKFCSRVVEIPRYKRCERCRKNTREAMARLRARNPEASARYQREFNERRRRQVLAHYGGRCICCGEDQWQFLALDHKNGGGNIHRKEVKARGNTMVGWIIANGYPDLFEIRCHNCNQAVGFYGSCPHAA